MQCPECDRYMRNNKCPCGFAAKGNAASTAVTQCHTVPVRLPLSDGQFKTIYVPKCAVGPCNNPGTMSHSISHTSADRVDWYCHEHFN